MAATIRQRRPFAAKANRNRQRPEAGSGARQDNRQFRRKFQPAEQGEGRHAEPALAHEAAAEAAGRPAAVVRRTQKQPEQGSSRAAATGVASRDAKRQPASNPNHRKAQDARRAGRESQDPQGKGTGKSDSQQASKQPGSGVGSQDGDKSIKQAEQLAAMGKISEIIGKRSANISGETTVEVQSTSQQLHTPYAQRGAQHTQGGAEIDRDEIPVALRATWSSISSRCASSAPAAKK